LAAVRCAFGLIWLREIRLYFEIKKTNHKPHEQHEQRLTEFYNLMFAGFVPFVVDYIGCGGAGWSGERDAVAEAIIS
jgi:hypothetical protein